MTAYHASRQNNLAFGLLNANPFDVGSPVTFLAGNSVSIDALPIATQEQLLAAASGLIVNRSGLSDIHSSESSVRTSPILRADQAQLSPPAAHRSRELSRSSQQLRRSIQSIRDSLKQIESQVHGISPRPMQPNGNADRINRKPLSASASIQSSIQSLGNRLDLPKAESRPVSKPTTNLAKREETSPNSDRGNEGHNRPRVWRRWVRLDRILETQATRWQSQAARLGVRVNFRFDAPTGQEVWTDVDILLHIVDQFVASMLTNARRNDSISINVGSHPEDEHWMQIAVKGPVSPLNKTTTRTNSPLQMATARKCATMLGGFLDQVATQDNTLCWKVHFPVDDILSWMKRASTAEQHHVMEVELLASHAEVLETKHWMFADRAFQAGLDFRHRAIMIAPKRYLLTSHEPFTDVASLRRRFQLQLDRIGARLLAGESQTFDLRCQNLGSLNAILTRIHDRIQRESRGLGATRTSSTDKAATPVIHSNVHQAHPFAPPRKLRVDPSRTRAS